MDGSGGSHNNGRRELKIIYLLFGKCLKMVIRNSSQQILFLLSVLLVYGGLWFMWLLTANQSVSYLSSEPYAKLRFDFECSPSPSFSSSNHKQSSSSSFHQDRSFLFPGIHHIGNRSIGMQCSPLETIDQLSSSEPETTPSDVLLQWLYTGSPVTDDDKSTMKLLELLSSLMMNGIPLVGLDGYIELSDSANKYFGKQLTDQILLSSTTLHDEFDGFFNIRSKRLIITPNNTCTRQFIHDMRMNTKTFNQLNVELLDDIGFIYEDNKGSGDIWAIIELVPVFSSDSICNMSTLSVRDHPNIDNTANFAWDDLTMKSTKPAVTIRMHPSAVPDTRNFDWTPLKRVSSRFQSGELLYFTSGFLSLQLELQQFIERIQYGTNSRELPSNNANWQESIVHRHAMMLDVAAAIVNSTTIEQFRSELKAVQQLHQENSLDNTVHFPLYHRAFPTREYTEVSLSTLYCDIVTD